MTKPPRDFGELQKGLADVFTKYWSANDHNYGELPESNTPPKLVRVALDFIGSCEVCGDDTTLNYRLDGTGLAKHYTTSAYLLLCGDLCRAKYRLGVK